MISRRAFVALGLGLPCIANAAPARYTVPTGYSAVGREVGVPPAILFAVAMEESRRLWAGTTERRLLPYPWTLNVAGTPCRFDSAKACLGYLQLQLQSGCSLVDIGLMQVCWKYHAHRFTNAAQAVDPNTNLRVGARILREHYDASAEWLDAIGRYHAPADAARARAYASRVAGHLSRIAYA